MRELKIFAWIVMMALLLNGCSQFSPGNSVYRDADTFFSQSDYRASLLNYQEIVAKYPSMADRALFEMGVIHSHPKNEDRNYEKSLECFQRVIRDYPVSAYRQDSEMMIFYLSNVTMKDNKIATQQAEIEALRQEVEERQSEIVMLQKKMEEQERKAFNYVLQYGSADKILIEKKERRLTLMSKGEVLKTYRVALGGNPTGPKERADDDKTPEGEYLIDSRNRQSRYHLSLHISYPNHKDRMRAKELGVAPGGDIMIHGLKNGFSSVGSSHSEVDWTKGCIAVTDEEIEEIDKLVKNGTPVEIRP